MRERSIQSCVGLRCSQYNGIEQAYIARDGNKNAELDPVSALLSFLILLGKCLHNAEAFVRTIAILLSPRGFRSGVGVVGS